MKINVSREVDNAEDWPLKKGHALIVKPYGQERWVRATFKHVIFPIVWVKIGDTDTCFSVTELGTRWIRCRKGKYGPPKMADENSSKGIT